MKKISSASAIFFLRFFLIYTSSGFVSGGKLFESVFGMDYFSALLLSAGVVVIYTFLGILDSYLLRKYAKKGPEAAPEAQA